jgi:ankyrin repeat protein
MSKPLPANPSLENLKKQAKTLKKAWQAGQKEPLARIRAAHPQYAGATDEQLREARPRLTDSQLVLAREAGFASWPQMKVAVESAGHNLADQFVETACLCYDDPHFDYRTFHVRAFEMLNANPWLAEANLWCAATAGNAAAARAFLDADPAGVNRPGPHGWTPLICACYSRVQPVDPRHSTLEVARLLLDHGADPNTFTMKGNADERLDQTPRRFTALAGLFGGGSTGLANQPSHPHWRELAELLLARGADPADEVALEIQQGPVTRAKLEILLRHGLKPEARGARGTSLMGRALSRALHAGDAESVKLLLAHHARTDEPFRGKTPWQIAMERGHLEMARWLEEAGAPAAEIDVVQRFVALCMAGDEAGVHALLASFPDLPSKAPKNLAQKAAHSGRLEAVELVLDLGFDPNFMDEVTALHNAAGGGKEEIARLLMSRGASLTIREPFYDGTPVEWADFFDVRHMRDLFLNEGAICLFDALDFDRLDRVPDVLARDPGALERPFAQSLSRAPKPEDWQTPLVRMVVRGKAEAVRVLLDHGANAAARHPDGRSLSQVARDKGFEEIAGLLSGVR